jgi:type IV pilus assembly protein PilP
MMTKRSGMGRLKVAQRIVIFFAVCIALALWGCESKKTQPKEPVVTKQIGSSPKTAKKPKKSAEPAAAATNSPAENEAEPMVVASTTVNKREPYNPIGKVDPFTPLYKEETGKKAEKVVVKPKKPERPRTPLEKLDLAQLKLTAVVTTADQRRALVEEASGKGYVVEVGTRIGLERGSVVEIDPDRIVIEHTAEDDFGKSISRKRELKLQKPPGD